jgi:hypothetical protein
MINKIAVAFLTLSVIAGCASVERSAKTLTEKICSLSDSEKTVLAEKIDEITKPNKIRIECD